MLKLEEYQRHFIGESVEQIYQELFHVAEYDETFLKYYAQLPIVRDLEADLRKLRSSPTRDEDRIMSAEKELARIKRTEEDVAEDVELKALRRENEQLKRQILINL